VFKWSLFKFECSTWGGQAGVSMEMIHQEVPSGVNPKKEAELHTCHGGCSSSERMYLSHR
jgi:hypothetical protein